MVNDKLIETIEKHVQDELKDFLGYEAGANELNGIVENILEDANERINEYIEVEEAR